MKEAGYHFIAFTEHDRLQTDESWLPIDPDSAQGRSMLDGGLLNAYTARFGTSWVDQRVRDGVESVRIRALDEYRHHFEEPGRFAIFNGEEVTTAWSGGQHYINVFNHDRAIGPQEAAASVDAINQTLKCRSITRRR